MIDRRGFLTLLHLILEALHNWRRELIKADETAMEIEHVADTNMEDPVEEVEQVEDIEVVN